MSQKLITRGIESKARDTTPIRVVVVTMDTHFASSFVRADATLRRDYPGLNLRMHAASEFAGNEALIEACRSDIAAADIVICGMLFRGSLSADPA